MSAANRGGGRVAHDAYETPQRLSRALVGLLPIAPGSRVLEPSAGRGSFVRAVRHHVQPVSIDAVEIRPLCRVPLREAGADRVWRADFLGWHPSDPAGLGLTSDWQPYDWVVGNPPFGPHDGNPRGAVAHVEHALSLVSDGGHVAFLLRTGFLESADRVDFWRRYPARFIWTLSERPGFVGAGGGTDATCYSLFWWTRGWAGTTGHDHLFGWKRDGSAADDQRRAERKVQTMPFVSSDQLRLPLTPDLPEIVDVQREGTLAEQFEAFHRANPGVYLAIVRIAKELRRQGWERGSMNMIFERIRWLWALKTQGNTFKMDNSYRSYYARLVMAAEADLQGFFETRRQTSGSWTPDLERLNVKRNVGPGPGLS